jgi:hypothetical protein
LERGARARAGRARALLAVLLALGGPVVATPVLATTYYIRPSPTGSDGNPGTSPSSAWATIGKANSTLVAGDVVVVYAGSYSQFPNPATSGTSYASRITYVGDQGSPGNVSVPGGSLTRRYVTLKGMRFSGGVTFTNQARYDSVAYAIVAGDVSWTGNKYCMVYRTTVNGGRFVSGEKAGISTEADTLQECVLDLGSGVTAQPHLFETYDLTQYCVFAQNRITLTLSSGASDVHPRIHYHTQYCTFRDNRWTVINNSSSTGWGTLVIRDSTSYNTFLRDTLFAQGPGECRILLSSSGSFSNSCRDNQWVGCFFKNSVGTAAYFQNVAWRFTMRNCVFAGRDAALLAGTHVGPNVIDHCTFFGSPVAGVANFDPDPDAAWSGTTAITNSIFYGTSTSPSGNYGVFHLPLAFQGHLTQDNNLFAFYGSNSAPGDRSIGWWTGGTTYTSRPGAGALWNQTYGQDGASRYGSPLFVDSTLANLNPHLRSGSAAIGMANDGGDVGAYPYGVDAIPPAAISDLAVSLAYNQTIVLTWTAPGDNGNGGGAASAYDLRYSTSPITDLNFGSATVAPSPALPAPPGTAQSYVLTGLTPNTLYYFAIKTQDDAGNWSPISNLPQGQTAASDVVPPAAIQNLGTGF